MSSEADSTAENNLSNEMEPTSLAVGAAAATTTTTNNNSASDEKVKVHFVAVGSAPIMKKTKFLIGADSRFSSVTAFLRKMLKLTGSGSSLFMYCNSAFVPGPDELVGDLRDCFNVRGELVIHYSFQEAWG
jgi:ubiquitin-like protein ATG12